jgi:hypothetical protein
VLVFAAICPASSEASVYWNLFNAEGESAVSATYVTYATLADMLADTNRTGGFFPIGVAGQNIVGGDSDGATYWNLFNQEGESAVSASYVTYATLADMLADTNRTGGFFPIGAAGQNIVGSGASLPPPGGAIPELTNFIAWSLLLACSGVTVGCRRRMTLPEFTA